NKVLAATFGLEARCCLGPFAKIFRAHSFSRFVVNADADFLQRFRGAYRKPILISGIKIHCDQGVIMRLDGAARMAISNLESIVSKCSCKLECVFASAHFGVCVRAENNARAQCKNQKEKP